MQRAEISRKSKAQEEKAMPEELSMTQKAAGWPAQVKNYFEELQLVKVILGALDPLHYLSHKPSLPLIPNGRAW